MQENLLKTPPQYHRALFNKVDNKRVPIETFTLQDLKEYYTVTFNSRGITGNAITVQQLEEMRRLAIESAPEMNQAEEQELLDLCKTYGLEVVLTAIDLLDARTYPKVSELQSCIPDAVSLMQEIKRVQQYGV